MRSKGATIIFGGLVLSSLLVVLVAGIIQAQGEPPEPPHTFFGTAATGATGDTATPIVGVEIRSKAKGDLTTVGPVIRRFSDALGRYGLLDAGDYRVFSNNLASGEELLFFLLSGDGVGEVATAAAVQAGDGDVDIVLQPRTSKFYKGVPLVVDVVVQPRDERPADIIDVFLNFDPLSLQVASLTTGDGKFDQINVSAFDNQAGTIDISVGNQPGVVVDALVATITFTPTAPAASTDVGFGGVFPRETKAFGGDEVHGNLSSLELIRIVQAVTEVGRFPITRSVRPVLFEIGGVDQVDLYIFGPPENVRLDPNDPVGELRPTFLWESPNTGGIPDAANDVISYQVRILPEELAFTDIGNTTSFTPTTDLTFGIHTFQVRAVGTGDRPDAVATLDVDIGIVVVNAAPSGGGGGGGAPADDPPVANAGSPETVDEGDRVALNGSLSADPAGDPITLSWRAPSGVSLSDTTAARPSFVAPDGPANLNFTLTVTDAGGLSDSASVAITVRNVPPTITNVTASPSSVIAGGSTTISVTATDPAGAADPLEYSFDCDGNRSFEIGPQDGRSASCTIDEGPEQTVNVKVEDGDGGSDEDGVSVAVRNVAPTVDAGADVTINEGGTFFSSGAFTDPGADSWTATVDYDDGSGTESLSLSGRAFTLRHDYGDNGVFNVVVEVDDGDDTGTDTVTVTVNNVSPDVADIANASTDEGDTFIHEGSFLDPGVEDTWTATVNYGDGSGAQTLALNPDNTFSLSQVYEDNGNFNVTVTVTDDDGGSDSSSFSVNVSNVAPVVDAGDGQSAFAGDTVDVLARFTDAGAGDTHAATIDWGDGTVELGSVDGNAGTAAGSHVYSVAGTFNVTVTVNDDDLGSDQDGLTVEVLVRVALPDEISITNFELSTTEPVPPESVTASFTVTNISNVGVTLNIDLFQNGDVVRSFTQFDLGPGDGRGLQHSLSEREPGTYAVQVFDQVRNYAIAPPQAAVSGLVIAPRVSGPRDTVTISAEVTNIGSVAGRFSVDLQIDGSSDVNEVRLVPGDSQTIVRFVRIPAQPPDSGVASTGPHSVNVGGLKGTYVIRPPDIRTDVRRQRGINRDTSRARGTDGQEFEIIEGDAFFGEGSITFSLPVRAPQGVNVASFADTTSGISVIGRDIQVPVRDPGGATILNLVGVLQQELQGAEDGESTVGTFERLRMVTQERQADLSADDPNVGRLGVSLDAVLDAFPAGVSVEATIKKELDAAARTSVEQAARQQGKTVANEAGMVSFETTNLDPVDDVGEVKVTMKVSALWVDIYGIENVRIAHISEDGSVENLVPVCTGPDGNNQYTCVGTTQRGLSEFSLLALVDIPAEFSARNLQITPAAVAPGEIAKITVEIVNDGFEAGSFSAILNLRRSEAGAGFDPIAVQEITLGSNESGIITFFVLREVEGDYQIEVEGREGGFSVFDRLDPANLRFTDLIVSPAEALPGEPVRISFVIANQGEESGRTEVEFRINEVLTELRSLAVAGREQLRVVFEFVPPAEGEFSVELIDPDELVPSLRGTILAKVPEVSATFSFDRPSITPLEVGPGQEVTVVSRLTNFGDLEGALTAILELDGEEVARQDVFRDPLVSGNVTFTITAPQEPGNYTLRLGGEVLVGDPALFPVQGTFRVLVAPLAVIVESLNVAPDPVLAGQRLTISVVLTNPTGQAGTRVLSLSIDGDPVVPDTSVALEAGETLTETFTVVAPAEAGTHTLAIDGLTSQFEVEAVGAPAAFNLVAPMFIDPSQVSPGQRVTISVVVRNDGGETGSTDVILSVRGTEVERQTVDIDPGGDETVVFQITRDDAGDYAVQVEAVGAVDVPRLTGSFSVVRLLSAVAGTISVEPALVESGTAVVISVDVTNSGTVDATETFVLTVDGTRVDDQTVTLAAGETSTITFTHIERDAGTHRANVDGQTAEFEVTEAVAAAGGGPIIIIIVVVVVVVVAAGAGGFLFLRRKSA